MALSELGTKELYRVTGERLRKGEDEERLRYILFRHFSENGEWDDTTSAAIDTAISETKSFSGGSSGESGDISLSRLSPQAKAIASGEVDYNTWADGKTPTMKGEIESELLDAGVDIYGKKELAPGEIASGDELIGDSNVMKIGQSKAATMFLNDLEEVIQDKENSNVFAPIRGFIGKKNPYHTETQAVQSQIDATKQLVGKYLEDGVLRKEDEVKYEKILPKVGDTQKVAQAKVENVRRMIENKTEAELTTLGAAGYDIDEILESVQIDEKGNIKSGDAITPQNTQEAPQPEKTREQQLYEQIQANPDHPNAQKAMEHLKAKGFQIPDETAVAPGVTPSVDSQLETSGMEETQEEDSIFGDLKEGFGSLVDRAGERADRVQQIKGRDQALLGKARSIFSQGVGFIGDIVGEGAITAGKAAISQEKEDAIKEAFTGAAGRVLQFESVQGAMEYYEKLKETNPEAAYSIEDALNILDGATSFGGASIGVKQTGKLLTKEAARAAKLSHKTAKLAGGATGTTAKFGTAQATGLAPDTIEQIVKNPEMFTAKEMESITRESVFGNVSEAVGKKIDDFSDLGKGYDPIRESGEFVNIAPDFFDGFLQKKGLKIVDGKIQAGRKSLTRESSDIKAIQKFYDDWGNARTLEADEFLNMRADLSGLAKFDKISGKTKASEKIAKGIRTELNKTYRSSITGLKELDDQFSEQIKEVKDLRDVIFKKDGSVKDNAISTIANLTGKGKEQKLAKFKELMPGIEGQVNILKAIEDISATGGQKVGTYLRGAAGVGGGFAAGGPAGAIVGAILTSPKVAVGILRQFGKAKKISDNIIGGIVNKMEAGTKLAKRELEILDDAIKDTSKKMEGRLKDGVQGIRPGMNAQAKIVDKAAREEYRRLGKMWDNANPKDRKEIGKAMDKLLKDPEKLKSSFNKAGTAKSASVTNINDFERAKSLSPVDRDIETKAFERILKEEDKLLNQYKKDNKNVINTDDFRKSFSGDGYVGHNAAAVQEPASYLTKKAFTEGLTNDGIYATFYAGGSGSGKTSAVKNLPSLSEMTTESAVILDSNLSSMSSAVKKIDEAVEAGKVPIFMYTYRKPMDAFENGVIKRMKDNVGEGGRIVPSDIVANNTIDSWNVIDEIHRKGYPVSFVDNSLGKGNQKLISYDEMRKKARFPKAEDLTAIFNKKVKELYEKGDITKDQYEAYIKKSS